MTLNEALLAEKYSAKRYLRFLASAFLNLDRPLRVGLSR